MQPRPRGQLRGAMECALDSGQFQAGEQPDHVCCGSLSGLESDIATCPVSANRDLTHRSKQGCGCDEQMFGAE